VFRYRREDKDYPAWGLLTCLWELGARTGLRVWRRKPLSAEEWHHVDCVRWMTG
jgi:hypothetical protein